MIRARDNGAVDRSGSTIELFQRSDQRTLEISTNRRAWDAQFTIAIRWRDQPSDETALVGDPHQPLVDGRRHLVVLVDFAASELELEPTLIGIVTDAA